MGALTGQDYMNSFYFDLETSSAYADFATMERKNPQMAAAFVDYCERNPRDIPEGVSIADYYPMHAGLKPMFGRIVCISYAVIHKDSNGDRVHVLQRTFTADIKDGEVDDDQMYADFMTSLQKVYDVRQTWYGPGADGGPQKENNGDRYYNETSGSRDSRNILKPCGFNIFEFDLPYLCLHLVRKGYKLPKVIERHDGMWAIDLMTYGKFKGYNMKASLEATCAFYDIPTPKDAMKGKEVNANFWAGNIAGIKTYCEKDVVALVRLFQKYIGLNPKETTISAK